MRQTRRIGVALFLGLTVLTALAVVSARPTQARPPGGGPGSCECADLDAPVICTGGKIYPNPCVAACFKATGCVPYGGGGGPQ